MKQYMEKEKGAYDNIKQWRENLLHLSASEPGQQRNDFWRAVVTKALSILNENQLQQIWWKTNRMVNNSAIRTKLMTILEEPMLAFFEHKVTTECLSKCKKDIPFLFIIDEAAYLYQTNYMHSFMWVMDEPLVGVIKRNRENHNMRNFFLLMLGTHSQISHFTPYYVYPSERYLYRRQVLPSVFGSLDWDGGVELPENAVPFKQSGHITSLVKWGRPAWLSLYHAFKNVERDEVVAGTVLSKSISYIIGKLREPDQDNKLGNKKIRKEESSMTTFALLAIRLHLDLDFTSPSRASKLVTSRLRWLVDIDPQRKFLITTYGSEPLVVEAAATAMNTPVFRMNDDDIFYYSFTNPWVDHLAELEDQLNHGYVNKGAHGELTARLLRTTYVDLISLFSSYGEGPIDTSGVVGR